MGCNNSKSAAVAQPTGAGNFLNQIFEQKKLKRKNLKRKR